MTRFLLQMFSRLAKNAADSCLHAEPKMVGFGLIASVGFPVYYFVWSYLIPQPYENLNLRLGAMLIASPLLVTRYWPLDVHKYLPLYWYSVLTLCLPFFFTFMLLQNQVNTVWSMSTVTAILLVILVIDTLNAVVIIAIGTVAAFVTYALVGNGPIPWADFLALSPIYTFAMVAGAFFNLTNEREQRAKALAARALGGHVAHELGNPLQTIAYSARQVKEHVPALVETYRSAKCAGMAVPPISENHLSFLNDAGRMTETEVNYSLMIIDMMLKKAGARTAGIDRLRDFNIMECVDAAIGRYAFKGAEERAYIHAERSSDFTVRANDVLITHVIFNLLQNALYAIKTARRYDAGSIRIWAVPCDNFNRLHVLDNGMGMTPQTRARIFHPFFSTRESGTGLGLHFSRDVMHRFGGEITCQSRLGEFTEFILHFPQPPQIQRGSLPQTNVTDEADRSLPVGARPHGARWEGHPAPRAS